jgi:hypothetical protein
VSEFGEEVLVPIVGILCAFGLPVLGFVIFRMLAHRERMEMIRHGLIPGTPASVRQGMPAASRAVPHDDALDSGCGQRMLRKGITLTFIGFAITLGLSFIGFHDDGWRPGPWLLGGLVPLCIGLAQVVIAVLSGATLGPPRRQVLGGTYYGATPASPAGPPPDLGGPYTYRPGATQELRPPSAPPERR